MTDTKHENDSGPVAWKELQLLGWYIHDVSANDKAWGSPGQ